MAADANIFQQYLKAPKSVMDYQTEMDQADVRKNALQLSAMSLDEKQQASQRAQQIRNALLGLGGAATDEQRIAALRGTATPEGFAQADSLEKALMERKKTGAQVDKDVAQTGQITNDARAKLVVHLGDAVSALQAHPGVTPQQVAATLQNAGKMYGIPDEMVQQAVSQIPQDPAQLPAWLQSKNSELMSAKERMAYIAPDANAQLQATTSRANNEATVGATIRGQNLTDARARDALSQGKVPPGYRANPDGTLTAIPGGPADLKMQGALNQDTQALTGSISSFDRLGTAANQVLNHPGLAGITGIRGKIPNVPGTAAADADALLETLKSQVGFGVLQDMRNNSKTGGALGSVSDAEGKRLEANLAALNKAQSLEQFQQSLKAIVDYSEKAKDRVREAYNLKHSGKANAVKPESSIDSLLDKYK